MENNKQTVSGYGEKNKFSKFKIFGIISISLLLIFLIITLFDYYKYKEDSTVSIKNEIKNQLEEVYGEGNVTVVENTKKADPSIHNPLISTNPRSSFLNSSSDEIAYITHAGEIGGVGNLYFNYTSDSTGYFSYLGSSISRITKGWFINLDVSANINSTNVTTKEIYLNGVNISTWTTNISTNWTAYANIYTDYKINSINTTANAQVLINNTDIGINSLRIAKNITMISNQSIVINSKAITSNDTCIIIKGTVSTLQIC
jgi:hypothetical protein